MRASSILPVLLLAACVQDPPARPDAPGGSCPAGSLQHLVGQHESAFDPGSVDGPVRIIHPGDAVTMDFSPDRLNVEIDADGVIAAVRCG